MEKYEFEHLDVKRFLIESLCMLSFGGSYGDIIHVRCETNPSIYRMLVSVRNCLWR